MNTPNKTIASKVVNTTANVLATVPKIVHGTRGAIADFKRTSAKAASNFANRSDNSNYYKGRSYWAKNKN